VLNEEANVLRLLEGLRDLAARIDQELQGRLIIVDDGSTDGTQERVEQYGQDLELTLLAHSKSLGPGAAFRTAFEHLYERLVNEDWVVTMEGDNTSRIDTLLHMLKRRHEGYDVVLASAYAYGGGIRGVETSRVLLSHCANGLAKLLLGLRGFHTLSSFFRLHSGSILRRLQSRFGPGIIQFAGFECMVELLLKLVLIKATISEVEMQLDWSGRRGKSKMRVLPAVMGYMRLLRAGWKWRREAGAAFWAPWRKG
jgi:dolichol-phosphate mannosyltransferase